MSFRVSLKVPLNPSTGYGRDGIGLSRALVRAGCDVSLEPSHVGTPLPWDVAQLLTVEGKVPFDARIHHLPPDKLSLTQHDLDTSYRTIAWSMWEFFEFPSEQAEEIRARTTGYDELLVYDDTSRQAYESLGQPLPPIGVLQGGYEPSEWLLDASMRRRDWHAKTFRFVIAGDLQPRKNPYVAMRVVQRLANEGYDVELVVKTRHEKSFPIDVSALYPCVKVFTGIWPQEQMRDYYASAHCYLAPSLGEGKNLPVLEAGTTGCAIIASDVGGHKQWAHEAFTTLVNGHVEGEYDGKRYLRVDEEELYEACKELVEDRRKAQRMGDTATQVLPPTMSWKRVVETLLRDHVHGKVR